MGDGIYTALSGALAQQHALDVVANNVANASTAGFRADRVVFGQLLAGAQADGAPVDPRQTPGPDSNKFVKVEQNALDTSSGELRATGNTLDVGIQGDGYFVVRGSGGDRLTRSGNFMMREDGALTSVDGRAVVGEDNHPIVFPRGVKDIQIKPDGVVMGDGQEVGRIAVKNVSDPAQLLREGTTTYSITPGAQLATPERVELVQGHLEASNVNAIAGMNELITIQRSFDALQRVIDTFQQIDQRTAKDLGSRNG